MELALTLLAPATMGRSLNFVFGAGDRGEGLYDAETRKRLAEVKSRCDPANLFRRNYGVSA
ncbi:BBE domain-containing protein [Streptomyces cellulosae]|uniref:BBE domain-containing protein n=1 Tax=Streptomyces cellulosae TaxID=1968 RepID=UPI0004CB2EE1|nr:BBE domain-containing protein [Streptomyces cellulosae]